MIRLASKYHKLLGTAIDQRHSEIYLSINKNYQCIIKIKPCDKDIDFTSNFDTIERCIPEDELNCERRIQIGSGPTNDIKLIYSIFVSIHEDSYIQYRLVMYLAIENSVKEIVAYVSGDPICKNCVLKKSSSLKTNAYIKDDLYKDELYRVFLDSSNKNPLSDEIINILRYITRYNLGA